MLFQASPWGLNYAQTVHFAGFCSILHVFQKRAKKSHGVISRYYSNRFSPKGYLRKKYKQTKKKRNQNRPSFKALHSLRSSESLASYWYFTDYDQFGKRGATPHVHALQKNLNSQTSSLPAWFIHSFIHTSQRIFPNICCKQKAISCKVCHFQVRLFRNIILG